jgi:acyl-CoA synthetase
MFTGGEAVPYDRAADFEERTGARVLQFYGSNETGALSCTSLRDDRVRRLTTAGRVIPEMHVRLRSEAGDPVEQRPGQGVPACRGPATCLGYAGGDDADEGLFTPDGWMLMGDIVSIDQDGYLRVIGRVSDFIIRGGKNISAVAVEEEVATHPAVALAAAVPMPDPIFGERVCAVVELRTGYPELSLEDLCEHLSARGVSKEWYPEHLIVRRALPRSSGGKVAKGVLRQELRTFSELSTAASEG